MAVGFDDFLAFAKDNLLPDDDSMSEIRIRCAISRAYYSAYHACLAYQNKFPSPGSAATGRGSHESLINQFKNPSPETCRDSELSKKSKLIGALLDVAKHRRHLADYNLASTVNKSEAKAQIQTVLSIIDKVR